MVNIIQLRRSSTTDQEAASWIARLDNGISADERRELSLWLNGNPERRTALLELAALWDELDTLAELADLFPLAQSSLRARRSIAWRWAAAAATVVAFLGAWLWLDGGVRHDALPAALSTVAQTLREDVRTTIGGREVKTLPDGSVVTLNTDTELAVEYSDTARDVVLKRGEANFAVVHNENKPFRVHVGDRVIQAVGTAFNVQLRPSGDVEVTVSEGRVRVGKNSPIVPERPQLLIERVEPPDTMLSKGQVAVLRGTSSPETLRPQVSQLEPADLGIRLAWQNGMIIFQGEPLPTVLSEVSRYADVEFVLADDALATIRVGGYFRTGDIDGLLVALRDNFQIESAAAEDNRIVLRSAR
jgi:transmembrane sensor